MLAAARRVTHERNAGEGGPRETRNELQNGPALHVLVASFSVPRPLSRVIPSQPVPPLSSSGTSFQNLTCRVRRTAQCTQVTPQIEKVQQWLGKRKVGVEIGAFKYPIPGIRPIYVDKYASFANEPCLADYQGEAVALPFKSSALDYVVSSHVLEHVANPVEALLEWYRVLRPGGIIYLIVPDRRFTWDRPRALTTVEHMLEDYALKTSPVDATHIADMVYNVDWQTYSPSTPKERVSDAQKELYALYANGVRGGVEINIHFHVFEPSNTIELIQRIGEEESFNVHWKIVDTAEQFPAENPNGFLCVIEVQKTFREKIADAFRRGTGRHNAQNALLPTAKRFGSID